MARGVSPGYRLASVRALKGRHTRRGAPPCASTRHVAVVVILSFLVSLNHASSLAQGKLDAGAMPTLGADRIVKEEQYFTRIRGKRIGLITNHTGVNQKLESTEKLFAHHPELNLVALFGPEHGIGGHAQAGQAVSSHRKVYSLYGEIRAPTSAMLKDVDVLIYDVQDVGVRFYTYISTLFECMKAAARHGLPLIVLDRPDPINASRVEGPVLEPGYESFVGIYSLPVRYGMTSGELAGLLNSEGKIGCDLVVVPMKDWTRTQWYDQTGLQWIMPSPGMASLATATVYPGLCLIEGTNLSEGRGTTRPFEFIGAPWLKNQELAQQLNRLRLPGVHFRPQAFTPTFSKYRGELCQGIQVHVLDRDQFQPIPALLHILTEVHNLHPSQLKFQDEFFDQLAGNSWIRQGLLQGRPVETLVRRWQPALDEFKRKRKKYLIYD